MTMTSVINSNVCWSTYFDICPVKGLLAEGKRILELHKNQMDFQEENIFTH